VPWEHNHAIIAKKALSIRPEGRMVRHGCFFPLCALGANIPYRRRGCSRQNGLVSRAASQKISRIIGFESGQQCLLLAPPVIFSSLEDLIGGDLAGGMLAENHPDGWFTRSS